MRIKTDLSNTTVAESFAAYQDKVNELHDKLMLGEAVGSDFTQWVQWPYEYDKEEFERIKVVAKEVQDNADVLVVCGIGGSYLGTRAAIEMIEGLTPKHKKMEIVYLGNTFSASYISQTLEYLKDKNFYLNVISKSGTTTETAIAFRLLKNLLEEKYGQEEASKRILATTDAEKGTLHALSKAKGYRMFTIPGGIGGRYSVICAVGLLPLAIAGVDIDLMMQGCQEAYEDLTNPDLTVNHAYAYAVARRVLETQNKPVEILVSYEPRLVMVAEWWKQLFGESEGKEFKGVYPSSVNFSTDLHSMGQFIQEGSQIFFETNLIVKEQKEDIVFPSDEENLDNMNYLSGKTLSFVNEMAFKGTLAAHHETAKIPNIILNLQSFDAKSFGYLAYFMFRACAISVALLDVNPFNQPGVEVYKRNMFKLLGKE